MRLRSDKESSQSSDSPDPFRNAMNADATESSSAGKFTGLIIDVAGLGKVELLDVFKKNAETTIYHTAHPGIVVKTFDLNCTKADEISYGPYLSWGLEVANFGDILGIEELRPLVPAYYGANIDYAQKYAFVAMEYLAGQDLKSWCEEASRAEFEGDWMEEFKEAVYEALSIMTRFHSHGIVLIDFKPDNIIRLREKGIRLVDLGAFFTPRHYNATDKYLYSATPDYAELLIDASNVQAGVPPTEASDIFSAGVALFEMATGASRLEIDAETADEILRNPAVFLFRDSQIRDIWQSYPHLKDVLPAVETQLRERRILFSELWHLLKGYLANKLSEWESLPGEQRDQIILATGTTFVMEQLPPRLQWLAGPIAQATVLRSMRLKRVADLMKLIANRISDAAREDIEQHNCLIQYLRDLERSLGFVEQLSAWEARLDRDTGHWTVAIPVACAQLMDDARFTFLKRAHSDDQGHKYFQIVGDVEADSFEDGKLTLWHLRNDHFAWLGSLNAGL
jgi:serine/threonine protein kinase